MRGARPRRRVSPGRRTIARRLVYVRLREFVHEGRLREPGKPGQLLTVGRSVGKRNRVLIYAVDESFEMRVGFDTARGRSDAVNMRRCIGTRTFGLPVSSRLTKASSSKLAMCRGATVRPDAFRPILPSSQRC